jgi:probable F420-dependent oxidoreductase
LRIGTSVNLPNLNSVPEATRNAESAGYDFVTASETNHNPFLRIALAAEHSTMLELKTSIAVAFARSPMDVAYLAWDLQAASRGRFTLGLGSQVRGHIVRRFDMPWSRPAARMREYVGALRAVWDSWQHGSKLDFAGEFYNLNLMPPFFSPGPIEHPDIKVCIAAVNSGMVRVAGEVCDGILLHSFNTPKHTREVVLPQLEAGAKSAGRSLDDFEIAGGGFIATGGNEQELQSAMDDTKGRIAFYASTPSYAPVMETHGWHDTAAKLYRMSVEGRWQEMASQITDEMLEAFAVVGIYDEIVPKIKTRYGSFANALSFSIPVRNDDDRERLRSMISELREG